MHLIATLHGTTAAFGGFHQFIGQALRHGFFAALARRLLDPAHGQGQTADRTHFHGHLVVGTAHAAGFHLDHGLDVVDRRSEHLEGVLLGLFLFDQFERAIDDALGNRFFAAFHDHVHEFGQLDIAELRIRQDFTFGDFTTTWHFSPLSLLQLASFQTPREPYTTLTYSTCAHHVRGRSLRCVIAPRDDQHQKHT